jgi:hypothetical protein
MNRPIWRHFVTWRHSIVPPQFGENVNASLTQKSRPRYRARWFHPQMRAARASISASACEHG